MAVQFLQRYADAVFLFQARCQRLSHTSARLTRSAERRAGGFARARGAAERAAGAARGPRRRQPRRGHAPRGGAAAVGARRAASCARRVRTGVSDAGAAVCGGACRCSGSLSLRNRRAGVGIRSGCTRCIGAKARCARRCACGCGSVRRAPLTCICASGNRVITATSTLLLLRGVADGSAAVASDAATGALRRAGVWPVVAWQPASAAFTARCASRPLAASGARCVAVVANRSSAVGSLSAAADGAAKLLDSGAYLHWFQRFDVSRDALQDGLEATRAVVAEYRSAHGHDIDA